MVAQEAEVGEEIRLHLQNVSTMVGLATNLLGADHLELEAKGKIHQQEKQ